MVDRSDTTHSSGDHDQVPIMLSNLYNKITKLDRDFRNFDDKQQFHTDIDKMHGAFLTVLSSIVSDVAYNESIKITNAIADLKKWLIEKSSANTQRGDRPGKPILKHM